MDWPNKEPPVLDPNKPPPNKLPELELESPNMEPLEALNKPPVAAPAKALPELELKSPNRDPLEANKPPVAPLVARELNKPPVAPDGEPPVGADAPNSDIPAKGLATG